MLDDMLAVSSSHFWNLGYIFCYVQMNKFHVAVKVLMDREIVDCILTKLANGLFKQHILSQLATLISLL